MAAPVRTDIIVRVYAVVIRISAAAHSRSVTQHARSHSIHGGMIAALTMACRRGSAGHQHGSHECGQRRHCMLAHLWASESQELSYPADEIFSIYTKVLFGFRLVYLSKFRCQRIYLQTIVPQ